MKAKLQQRGGGGGVRIYCGAEKPYRPSEGGHKVHII